MRPLERSKAQHSRCMMVALHGYEHAVSALRDSRSREKAIDGWLRWVGGSARSCRVALGCSNNRLEVLAGLVVYCFGIHASF